MIEEGGYCENDENSGTESSRKTVEAVGDIDSVDDEEGSDEGENGGEKSDFYFVCDGSEVDIVDTEFCIKSI